MKRIYVLIALFAGISGTGFCGINPDAVSNKDSLVILFGKKTQIVIHTEDKEELQKLKNFDFNALFEKVLTLSETSQKTTAAKDTSFVLDGDSVTVKGNDVLVKDNDKSVTFTIRIGKNKDNYAYREDEQPEEIEISDDDSTIVIITSKSRPRERKEYRHERKHKDYRRTDDEFVIDLGLNNYLENDKFPDESNAAYGLRPLGSRYIALGYQLQTRIGGRKSPLSFNYGIEFSANNFMFDRDVIITKGTDAIEFTEANRNLRKSKLTVWYVSLPVMPVMLDFGRRGRFRIGAGGYAGYRIHSYSKIMYFEDGKQKDHNSSNFYLSNFRYGLIGQIGFKDINIFVKYDLNPLFSEGKGPDLRAISFGIRI